MTVLPGMLPVLRQSDYEPLTRADAPKSVRISDVGWSAAPSIALFDTRTKAFNLQERQAFLKPLTHTSFKGLPDELKPIMVQDKAFKDTDDVEVRLNHPQIIRAANGDVIFSREEVTRWKDYSVMSDKDKEVFATVKTGTHILIFDKDMNFKAYKHYQFSDLGESNVMKMLDNARTVEDIHKAEAAMAAKQKGYLTSYFTLEKGKLNKSLNLTKIDRNLTDTSQLSQPDEDDLDEFE